MIDATPQANLFGSLNGEYPDGECSLCASDIMDAFSYDELKKCVTFAGRAVQLNCCKKLVHASCLNKHLNSVNDTPADYGMDDQGLIDDIERAGSSVDEVFRDNAQANAVQNESCPYCRMKIESFSMPHYKDPKSLGNFAITHLTEFTTELPVPEIAEKRMLRSNLEAILSLFNEDFSGAILSERGLDHFKNKRSFLEQNPQPSGQNISPQHTDYIEINNTTDGFHPETDEDE